MAALANHDDPRIAAAVLKGYSNLPADVLAAAQNLLVTRKTWALQFLKAIDEHAIDAQPLPREILERLSLLGDPQISELAARHFGPITPGTSAELHTQIQALASVVRSGPGVPKPGKQIFEDQCARCHALFGKGGNVGPDLTTYRRDDLETMLLNIVNPSAEIREGYTSQVIATNDGRTLTGIIVDQDHDVIVLRGADGKQTALSKDAIEQIKPSKGSLMPEGLLKSLGQQQVRDLFAYLRTTQPLID
jgi:putative heme-binding domain-containing protein